MQSAEPAPRSNNSTFKKYTIQPKKLPKSTKTPSRLAGRSESLINDKIPVETKKAE